jgi:hypothetical protein
MSDINDAEKEFQDKINNIINSGDVSTDDGRREVSEKLNDFLKSINRINVGRDLVADVYTIESEVKIDIFCRNERIDQLKLKLSEYLKDAVKNSNEISELNKYINRIQAIGITQI